LFYLLSKTLDVLLSPLAWALVLGALSVPWRRRGARRWRRRRAFGVAALAVLFVFSSPAVGEALWRSLEEAAVRTYRPDVTYDAVVLLGGVGDEDVWRHRGERALNDNVERLTATSRLLHEGRAHVAILSGGPPGPFDEARELASYLREWNVPEEQIVLEEQARNTRENAVYAAEIVRARGYRRVLVVTSAFHVPRAADCFRAVGLDVDFLPVDYRAGPPRAALADLLPRARAFETSSAALREILGRLVYRLRGYGKAAG
jgi:uncharacterized SAM-binding protein YcdF (DUF218 family)